MDQDLIDDNFCESGVNEDVPLRNKNHGGEKSNKCNLCNYASSHTGHLRKHLKKHSGEKSNKCNNCDFASSYVSGLRKHLECTVAKSQTNATNVTLHLFMQARWGHI